MVPLPRRKAEASTPHRPVSVCARPAAARATGREVLDAYALHDAQIFRVRPRAHDQREFLSASETHSPASQLQTVLLYLGGLAVGGPKRSDDQLRPMVTSRAVTPPPRDARGPGPDARRHPAEALMAPGA